MGVVVGVLRPGRTDGEGDLAGLELEEEIYERKGRYGLTLCCCDDE